MKALVTGGTGFTGSHLVRRLLGRGHEVRSLDNQKGLFSDELEARGAKVRLGSITDREVVDEMVRDCEVVYHLAAAFRELNVSDARYRDVNVGGTRHVADACHRFKVRKLVYCSTQGVHGDVKSPPGDEGAPIAPEDYYQHTKYEGEKVVQEYVEKGLDALIVRPTAIYGPGDPARFLMLFKAVKKGRFLMFGDGKTFYHPVYIDNLVDGFERAAECKAGAPGQAYILGDEKYWTLNELVEHVGRAMGVPVKIRHLPYWPLHAAAWACEMACKPFRVTPPLFRRRVNWFRQDRAFSIDRARRDLGYEPKVGIEQGLAATAKWYRENNYL